MKSLSSNPKQVSSEVTTNQALRNTVKRHKMPNNKEQEQIDGIRKDFAYQWLNIYNIIEFAKVDTSSLVPPTSDD